MSDRMKPVSFETLMKWIIEERRTRKSVCFVKKAYEKKDDIGQFFGPAAGPHTQLAQNIIASYYAGARFFELKTVQILDGEDLPVSKPCIKTGQEAYNVEWSTELYVKQAMEEYIKAWCALFFMAKEWDLGTIAGYRFNMSVGYDLAGIQSKKIDDYLEQMKDASDTDIFLECKNWFLKHAKEFKRITKEDINHLSPCICDSVTLSTLHGCPPDEIEKIASYLITEKKLNTFVKLNPTLLGYEKARKLLDELGYHHVSFGKFHFEDDLQFKDAVPMLERLGKLAKECKKEFGVKITNTFPVDITRGELPGEEMYMSGNPLYVVSLSVAKQLTDAFNGKLRISYSGGADAWHLRSLIEAGIYPVTMATTLLKPGGYQRFTQMAEELTKAPISVLASVDGQKVKNMIETGKLDKYCISKAVEREKNRKKLPLSNCFSAPCEDGCPINQDICAYMNAAENGEMERAFSIILEKNPLPFITGTICPHTCMVHCNRNYYEEAVHIRKVKLAVSKSAYENYKKKEKQRKQSSKRVAIIGGGPAGLSAAYFLAREGVQVCIYEKEECVGGIPYYVIPEFRIAKSDVQKDIDLICDYGIEIKNNTCIQEIQTFTRSYDAVILAIGAGREGRLLLQEGKTTNALSFLREFVRFSGKVEGMGKHIVVVGGGNTAIDTARAAKRVKGVETVRILYRRMQKDMPADLEEMEEAKREGILISELKNPVSHKQGVLRCVCMRVNGRAKDGRSNIEETQDFEEYPADTILAAVGEGIEHEFYNKNAIITEENGKPRIDEQTLESSLQNVYIIGDGCHGAQTVVKAIADARRAADAILLKKVKEEEQDSSDMAAIYSKRGMLQVPIEEDSKRCLQCKQICEMCVEVCPNRANLSVTTESGKQEIVHLDALCNECGNCMNFCPYEGAPYLDKFTYFSSKKDLKESENQGFAILAKDEKRCLVRYEKTVREIYAEEENILPKEILEIINAFLGEDA